MSEMILIGPVGRYHLPDRLGARKKLLELGSSLIFHQLVQKCQINHP